MSNKQEQKAYWFLTINEHAECFEHFQELIIEVSQNEPTLEYAYIKHNADDDEKNLHYHLTLYFKDKVKRFTTIQNIFCGAHIEPSNKNRYKRCVQYLIHKNDPNKQQYKANEIISNISEVELSEILNGNGYDFELFEEGKINSYLDEFFLEYGCVSIQHFVNRFGLGAISKYYFCLKDYIGMYNNNYVTFNNEKLSKLEIAWNEKKQKIHFEYLFYKREMQQMGIAPMDEETYCNDVYARLVDEYKED